MSYKQSVSLFFCVLLLLSACTTDPAVGTWRLTKVNDQDMTGTPSGTIEFFKNGSVEIILEPRASQKSEIVKLVGTYTINEKTIPKHFSITSRLEGTEQKSAMATGIYQISDTKLYIKFSTNPNSTKVPSDFTIEPRYALMEFIRLGH